VLFHRELELMLDREEGIYAIKLTRKTHPIFDVNDIIESKRMEERLMKLNETLLSLGSDFDRNIQVLIENCGKLLNATCALYNRLANGMLYSAGKWQAPEDLNLAYKPDGHICYDVIKRGEEGRAYIVRNLQETHYFETDPNVARYGLRTYIGYPVCCFGQAVGSLCAVYKEDVEFDEKDKKIFEIFAKAVGVEEERKQAKEALRESEERYRNVFEGTSDLIQSIAPDGRILYVNRAWRETLGYSEEEIRNLSVFDIVHPDSRAHCMEVFQRVVSGEKVGIIDATFVTKDGKKIVVEGSADCRFADGRPVSTQGIFRNVTEHKRAEEEIRRNYEIQTVTNSLLRISLENIPLEDVLRRALDLVLSIPWLVFQSRGSIFLVEDEPEVLVMKAQNKLAEPIQKACARVPFGRCHCGQAALTQEMQFADHLDDRHTTSYDDIIPHGHYCVPILFAGRTLGVINLYVEVGHQRSEKEGEFLTAVANTLAGIIMRRRAEEERERLIGELKVVNDRLTKTQQQLVQAEKLASIGQLAAGVAHEINNPLTGVLGYSSRLAKKLENKNIDRDEILRTFPRDLKIIKDSALRCEQITKSLLAFARQAKLEMAPMDINETMERTLMLIGHNLRLGKVDVVKNLQQNLPPILGSPHALQQVFTNLALNAGDAMSNGGTLTVATRKENGNVLITFADTGTGIPKENLGKMFEPFFTTKSTGKGTGLGLSVAYGIIQEHNGRIEVESESGKGATFRIMLPILNKTEKEVRING